MENTGSRFQVTKSENSITLQIKAYNTMFNAMAAVFVLGFVASVFIFGALATHSYLSVSGSKFTIGFAVPVITVTYAIASLFLIARAVIWTISGSETLIINPDKFSYSKKALIKLASYEIRRADMTEFKEIDYIEPKDVIYAVKAELGFCGKCFLIKTADKAYKFGIYLGTDELRQLESIPEFKSLLS